MYVLAAPEGSWVGLVDIPSKAVPLGCVSAHGSLCHPWGESRTPDPPSSKGVARWLVPVKNRKQKGAGGNLPECCLGVNFLHAASKKAISVLLVIQLVPSLAPGKEGGREWGGGSS